MLKNQLNYTDIKEVKVLSKKGNLKEAEEATLKAIQVEENFADAYLNLGTILQDQGKLKEALEITRKAIKIN